LIFPDDLMIDAKIPPPPNLLVVDDTPENLALLGELLQPEYVVRAATNGIRALQIAATMPQPELILLDVMMPDMDGYEVLARLKADPRTAAIPVIFITAMDRMEDEEHGLDSGAVDYITKPLRPAIVLARVRTQLDLKHARDRLSDQNSWLESQVALRMRENQMIQNVSMRALASLAETRDNETGNHIRRTQGYVSVLAAALANHPRFPPLLRPEIVDLIIKAAPLHDIGKVGIPDAILLKPGKLTLAEWAVKKSHCRLGSDAIMTALQGEENHGPLAFLHVAMDIAHSHHEKWDGSGYPEQLSGDMIPVSARLMAVADVFDALISRRVYKPALPLDESIEIIRSGRGSHFDPDIVDAFLACIDEFSRIAKRYADTEESLEDRIPNHPIA
jgi:putative two-component system response regulator